MVSDYILTNYLIMQQFGGAKIKWHHLQHNGVMFPPEYVKHNIPVVYDDKEIVLDTQAEEYATLYAKYIETEYVKNKTFNKNFFKDWSKVLGRDSPIKSMDNLDFSQIYNYLLEKKAQEKADPISKDEKLKAQEKYTKAIVDNKIQPVGNFRIEPPGIFLGRGCNPKLGKIKRRIYPEDIIINIGREAPVPPPLPGHKWKQVIHDKTVEWLASWRDDITGKTKYVWLGAHSDMKGRGDMAKFDLARKLKRKIKSIRAANDSNLDSDDMVLQQVATAMYFIDVFSLRVGNEKASDETDTVGVTSLRVEHIELLPNNKIKLDFLGKDSVRYNRTLDVDPKVWRNVKNYMADKQSDQQLFDAINSADVNKYLQNFMKNLTAKVFRTYNASNLFQKELSKITKKFSTMDTPDKVNLLLDEFNKANAKVAVLCNHQKNINANASEQLKKLDTMISTAKKKLAAAKKAKKSAAQITRMTSTLTKLKSRRSLKVELKNISLGTSKINYIDPRITVAFMKAHDLPVDKLFSKALQEKFKWASDTPVNYKF